MTTSNRNSKIALYVPSMRGGGAERVMLNLASGFAQRDFPVDLVLSQAEGPYLSQVHPQVNVVDLKAHRVLASLPGLVRYLRSERPRVVLSTLSHANIVALMAKFLSRTPTRFVVREATVLSEESRQDSALQLLFTRRLFQFFYRYSDKVVAVSNGVFDDMTTFLRLPAEKIQVIYNPVVTPDLADNASQQIDHPWFEQGAPPVILAAGRLSKEKGFAELIRAFARVRRQCTARLVILGEGQEREALEGLARELGAAEDVSLPGFVLNPYPYMARAAVFVLPSFWEGLPNALIQAMSLGTPVVATDCKSGPAEILENGTHGKLVPVGQVDDLADAIIPILEGDFSKQEPERLKARSNAFGFETSIAKYLETLLPDGV